MNMDISSTWSITPPSLVTYNLRKSLDKEYTSLINGDFDLSNHARLHMLIGFHLNVSATTLSLLE